MKKVYIAITILCLALSAGLLIRTAARGSARPAYTIDYMVTERDASGNLTGSYQVHRLQSASGNWKDVKNYEDGSVHILMCDLDRGAVFDVEKDHLIHVSGCSPHLLPTDEQLRQSPLHNGQVERILGFDTVAITDGPATFFKSGALGGEILKIVLKSPDGSTVTQEATKITLGEPEAHRMEYPKDLPVDETLFEKRQASQRLLQK
ncbi:MAG TPA: hypothetical protein VKB86_08245 [Pyrinomonadaceae bacterium]|nr:hypothetical protein [Pyrinomonadaceae bacterium]